MASTDPIHTLASGFPAAAGEAAGATVVALPIVVMARFRRLMQYEGWEVDLPRMCTDTAYAYRCLANAHTSSSEPLRRAAMVLFETYDRNVSLTH
jgi:hypothetical protein